MLRWSHQKPIARYPDIVKEFGDPVFVVPQEGGLAVWRDHFPFDEIVIKDEDVPHCCPAPHADFLTASIKVDITNREKLQQVLGISKSIWYDQLQHRLFARCHFMGANVASLLLATNILTGKQNGNDPKLYQVYGKMVMDSMDAKNYDNMKVQLITNVKQLPYTEPEECSAPTCKNVYHQEWP